MFGLRLRIEDLASQLAGLEWVRRVDVQEREKLAKQVAELTQALEWHVGTSLEIILAEKKIIELKLAERVERQAQTGGVGTPQEQMAGMVIPNGEDGTKVDGADGCC